MPYNETKETLFSTECHRPNMYTVLYNEYQLTRSIAYISNKAQILHNDIKSSRKHAYIMFTPYIPFLYSISGVYSGIHYFFLISAQKHRLWVLVRTASPKRF